MALVDFYYALLALGSLAGWVFIVAYTARFKWWRNDTGRGTMLWSLSVTGFYSYFLLAALFPHWQGRLFVRLVLFLMVTLALVTRLLWLWALMHLTRRK